MKLYTVVSRINNEEELTYKNSYTYMGFEKNADEAVKNAKKVIKKDGFTFIRVLFYTKVSFFELLYLLPCFNTSQLKNNVKKDNMRKKVVLPSKKPGTLLPSSETSNSSIMRMVIQEWRKKKLHYISLGIVSFVIFHILLFFLL